MQSLEAAKRLEDPAVEITCSEEDFLPLSESSRVSLSDSVTITRVGGRSHGSHYKTITDYCYLGIPWPDKSTIVREGCQSPGYDVQRTQYRE